MKVLNILPKNDADDANNDQTDFTKVLNLPTDDLKRGVDLDNQQEEILKMLRESEAALESKIKEVKILRLFIFHSYNTSYFLENIYHIPVSSMSIAPMIMKSIPTTA